MRPDPRRRGPRPMASVLEGVMGELAPTDPLARLQTTWPQIAGRKHAAHSAPVRMRGDGTMVIRCESGALAAELQLREPQLTAMISEHLELKCALRFEGPVGRR